MSTYRRYLAVLAAATLLPSFAYAELKPETDEQKTLYALGLMLSHNLGSFNLTADELKMVQAGMTDGLLGKDTHGILPQNYQQQVQALAQERAKIGAAAEAEKAQEFLAKAEAAEGAQRTPSGLIYTILKEGKGPSPTATDRVKVHYHGTLRDGSVFDSSVNRGEPATFGLNQVIPCWTEGVQKIKVGGKAKLVCPADIAYGDRGAGAKIKPGAALTFEVELLEIVAE